MLSEMPTLTQYHNFVMHKQQPIDADKPSILANINHFIENNFMSATKCFTANRLPVFSPKKEVFVAGLMKSAWFQLFVAGRLILFVALTRYRIIDINQVFPRNAVP